MKAATISGFCGLCVNPISIHAAREGGDKVFAVEFADEFEISIHAAREGGDGMRAVTYTHRPKISIHAAREGGDCTFCAAFGLMG